MMSSIKEFAQRKPKLTSFLLWLLAIIVTIICFQYQDKTGPTQPLEGYLETNAGTVHFKLLRSETIGTDLKLMLIDPVPEGITGYVKFRRYKSHDDWSTQSLIPGEFEFSRRGRTEKIKGMGAALPSLNERAGKYEFYVYIGDNGAEPVSITGDDQIFARYKAKVPMWALLIHILIVFISMMLAIRTLFEAIIDGKFKKLLWATIYSFLLGAFIFGPIVQWYAFGVWWSGIPFGHDWTDNKVLVELAFWGLAAFLNRGDRRNRGSVYLAGIVTLLVYFIPHSIFGSEYNYQTGSGHGTAD